MVVMREHIDKNICKKTKERSRELGACYIKGEENKVKMIKSCLERWLPKLWSPTQCITNFAMAITATDEMKTYSLDVIERGAALRDSFIEGVTSEMKKCYFSSIKSQPIKLFSKKRQ